MSIKIYNIKEAKYGHSQFEIKQLDNHEVWRKVRGISDYLVTGCVDYKVAQTKLLRLLVSPTSWRAEVKTVTIELM
jgi:hypothetical protein